MSYRQVASDVFIKVLQRDVLIVIDGTLHIQDGFLIGPRNHHHGHIAYLNAVMRTTQ
ncbi:hypothetical protein [Ideonella paludis]|uniref:hypothetical protein n=1 Tax=Ideonella paludis TaxID=1233411 RepID=UPI00362705D3